MFKSKQLMKLFVILILVFSIMNLSLYNSVNAYSTVNNKKLNEIQSSFNIDNWHKEGYKGDKVEIIVIDKGDLSSTYKNIKNVEDPFGNVIVKNKEVKNSHLSNIVETIHLNVPNAKIYVFQDVSMIYIHEWIVENKKDIDLINFSLSRNLTEKEKDIMPKLANMKINLITAIGNNAAEKVNPVSSNTYWISVGAVNKDNKNEFKRVNYSGISNNLDYMSHTNIPLEKSTFTGTSSATAFLSGMLGVYIDSYKKNESKKPTRTHIQEMMQSNLIKTNDMIEKEYGNGIFRLPSLKSINNEKLPNTTDKIVVPSTVLKSESKPNNINQYEERGVTLTIINSMNVDYLKFKKNDSLRSHFFNKVIIDEK